MPLNKVKPGQTYTNGKISVNVHLVKDGQVYYCRWRGEWKDDYDWRYENAQACRMKIDKFEKEIKALTLEVKGKKK
jgi:hypothetical protein